MSHCAQRRLQSETGTFTLLARRNKELFMTDVQPELIALGFIWDVAFLFSTTCHEAAHALAAKIGGGDTAFAGGPGSRHPAPHIQRGPGGMGGFPSPSVVGSGT